jgi:hypothetical protein
MTKNKNEQLTTMTITVKKDLKNVLRIIAKDVKSTPNQLVEVILAQFAGGLIEQARQIKLQQEAKIGESVIETLQKQQTEVTNDKPDTTEA